VILAAGRGTRLSPITDETPKALVPFLGRPLIDHAAAHLVSVGITRIAVNTHHLGAMVTAHVERALRVRYPQVAWYVSVETELLGTGGALSKLRRWLGQAPFLVVNADAVFDADLLALVRHRQRTGADAVWMTTREPRYASLRVVTTNAAGELNGITREARDSGATFCGVHLASRGLLDTLPTQGASCVVRDGYLPWIARGARVAAWETEGFWADTGTPERYVDAHRRGLTRIDRWRSLGLLARR
jgi:NDP-sugar pyrophosphorylase family protein